MPDWIIQWWATALFGGIVGALAMAVKSLRAKQKTQEARQGAVEDGIKAILHSELYKECGVCERKGYATIDDLKNIEYLYNPYHALNGNGTGTTLYERVKQLPGEPAGREAYS